MDKRVAFGIGIGLIISSIFFSAIKGTQNKKVNIEEEARKLGMHYEDECKVIIK